MSVASWELSDDIMRIIGQNVQFKKDMNSVIRDLSRASEGVDNEFLDYDPDEDYYQRKAEESDQYLEIFVEILDISFKWRTNEEYQRAAYPIFQDWKQVQYGYY